MAGSAVIGALRVNLGIDTAAFSNGLANAQSGLKRFASMAKVGLAAAAAAAGVLALAVKGTINAADDMSKAAQKIGIPIEELSRLKYAADLSGVSFEQLQTSVGKLSRNMAEALENPTSAAAKAFGNLGVAVTNADGTLRSSSDVMKDIADRFAAMPDGAAKTAAAMELMGRAGAGMIPMLNGGAEGLGKLMAEADQFGQVFTKEMGANAELFNDNISRLQGALGMLVAKLATELMPHLVAFTNWLVANAPAITAFVVKMVEFGASVVQLGVDVYGFVTGAWAAFEAAWDGMLAKVDAVKQRISTFASELVAMFTALPGQMMEIGGQIIDGLWQGIQAKWESVKASITGLAGSIAQSIKDKLGIQSPSKVMHAIGVNIVEGLQTGMDSMSAGMTETASGLADGISQIFEGMGSAIAGLFDRTKSTSEKLKDLLKSMINTIFSMMGSGGGLGGLFKGLLGGLLGFKNGGSFTVGGAGGIDSQLVAFKASPGEQVNVSKAGQGGSGRMHLTFGLASDGALNIMPEVRSVAMGEAASAAGRVAKGVPAMVDQRSDERQMRRIRPTFAGA